MLRVATTQDPPQQSVPFSRSSGVPTNLVTARCSTAVKAASTTSSTDSYPTNDGLNRSLLFRRAMNGHGVLRPVFVVFGVGEHGPSGKSQKGSLLAREGTGCGWLR